MKDTYTMISREGGCFACVNSGKGFLSYFDTFLAKMQYLYVIKGGPGTGKSGLMAYIAKKAEEKGEKVQRIYCSSDPDSLDGVILLQRQIAVVDGTAPHIAEPHAPGVDSEIVNLGAFWDSEKLQKHRTEIEELNRKKSESYARAFSLLSAARSVCDCRMSLVKDYTHPDLISRTARKILTAEGSKTGNTPSAAVPLPLASIGMKGAVRLDTHVRQAEKIFTLPCFYGIELLLLEKVKEAAEKRGTPLFVSPDPLTLYPDSVYLPEKALLVRRGEQLFLQKEKTLSLRRLVALPKDEKRKKIRAMDKEVEILWHFAENELSSLSSHHFAIEKIYGSAMDFSAIDFVKEELVKRILA